MRAQRLECLRSDNTICGSNASKRSQFAEHGRDEFRNGLVNLRCPGNSLVFRKNFVVVLALDQGTKDNKITEPIGKPGAFLSRIECPPKRNDLAPGKPSRFYLWRGPFFLLDS